LCNIAGSGADRVALMLTVHRAGHTAVSAVQPLSFSHKVRKCTASERRSIWRWVTAKH